MAGFIVKELLEGPIIPELFPILFVSDYSQDYYYDSRKIKNVVLLMDIDITKLNDMLDVIHNLQGSEVIVLVALTSGDGSHVLGKNLRSFLSLDKLCQVELGGIAIFENGTVLK